MSRQVSRGSAGEYQADEQAGVARLRTGKEPNAGKDWGQEKGMTEDEMVRWHHRLNGYEFM